MQKPERSTAILGTFRHSMAVRAASMAKAGAFYEESPRLTRYGFDVRFPLFNGALGARLSRREAHDKIARDQAFFEERQLPFCWWVDSNAEPAGLGNLLEKEGFQSPGPFVCMVTDLSKREKWAEGNSEVVIREVLDRKAFATFNDVLQQVFGLPKEIGREYRSALRRCGLGQPWHHYVAYLGNEPVGMRSLFRGKKVSLLFHAGVQLPHRGRGIATAMTRRALIDADRMGSTHCAAMMMAGQQARPLLDRFLFAEQGEITPYVFGADVEALEPRPANSVTALAIPSSSLSANE